MFLTHWGTWGSSRSRNSNSTSAKTGDMSMTQPGTVPDWWVCIQTYVPVGWCLQTRAYTHTHTHTHNPSIIQCIAASVHGHTAATRWNCRPRDPGWTSPTTRAPVRWRLKATGGRWFPTRTLAAMSRIPASTFPSSSRSDSKQPLFSSRARLTAVMVHMFWCSLTTEL